MSVITTDPIFINMLDSQGEKMKRRVLAHCYGEHIAVNPNPDPEVDVEFWNVTHVPTGLSFVSGLSENDAHSCAKEILDTGRDLSTTNPNDLPLMEDVKAIAVRWRDRHAHVS